MFSLLGLVEAPVALCHVGCVADSDIGGDDNNDDHDHDHDDGDARSGRDDNNNGQPG